MDITLGYDTSVLEATEVIKGGLTTNSLFEYNILDGTIKISLADKAGFSGDGSIAYIRFNVIGYEGSVSPLEIVSLSANRAEDMALMNIPTQDGLFTVISVEQCRGDCTGDGKITAADALCALQMAVGKRAEDLVMDVNGDGKVSSVDAREILKKAVAAGLEEQDFEKESPIEKCQPMEEIVAMGENIDMDVLFKIKGGVDGNCEIYEKIVMDNTGYGFEGKDMTCLIPMGAIAGDSPLSDNIKDYCEGPLADAIRELTMDVENK